MNDRVAVRNFAALLFVAALLTKETAWTLPFALLLGYRLRNLSWQESFQRTRLLWIALLIGGVSIAATPAYRRMLTHVFSIRSPLDNMALQVDGWWYLLTHPLLLHTNIDPDLPSVPAFDAMWWLRAVFLIFGALAACCIRQRWIQFALLWFFLHLLPTNSLLPRNDIANDRQLYLALIGPALAIAYGLMTIPRSTVFISTTFVTTTRIGLVALLLAVCGAATWQRNRDYRDEITLWETTARSSPNKARVWNNVGYAYQLAGRHDAAIEAYERALVLDASYDRARINLHLLRDDSAEHP